MRIISLVPSLTELLFDLGLSDQVIGRTRFCIHPAGKIESVEIVGGTKNPTIEKIKALKPDLVIANNEENRREDVEQIKTFCEVLVTEIKNVDEGISAIHEIGKVTDRKSQAEEIINQIEAEINKRPTFKPVKTAYLIWKKPYMTIGKDTYIHDVMNMWGFENIFGDKTRYPELTINEIKSRKAELILLSSEPYPFTEKHITEIAKELLESNVMLVNGEWFSWYGSRMVPAFRELNTMRAKI